MRHPVIETLYHLHDQIQQLKDNEVRKIGKELVAMWDCGTHGVITKDHDDVTLALAGLARQVAREYDFPGDFKD